MDDLSFGDAEYCTRRRFLQTATSGVASMLAFDLGGPVGDGGRELPLRLEPSALAGGCARVEGPALVPGAEWYEAQRENDGLEFRFAPGALAGTRFLTADIFADSPELPVFQLRLREAKRADVHLVYGVLPQAEARMRMRADAITQNRWQFLREGAWLKPTAGGSRVDLSKVDRMRFVVLRKSQRPVRWCQTRDHGDAGGAAAVCRATAAERRAARRARTEHDASVAGENAQRRRNEARLKAQLAGAPSRKWPAGLLGMGRTRSAARESARPGRGSSGRITTARAGGCSTPMAIRSGPPASTRCAWTRPRPTTASSAPSHGCRRQMASSRGSTTCGATAAVRSTTSPRTSSAHSVPAGTTSGRPSRSVSCAVLGSTPSPTGRTGRSRGRRGFPYVRPLAWGARGAPMIYRDFPDVFDPRWEADAARFGEQLAATRDDPAFIGYFLMNEPTWGFARERPPRGCSSTRPAARRGARSPTRSRRSTATTARSPTRGGSTTTLAAVREGEWRRTLTPPAERDLAEFSTVMVDKFFSALSASCRRVDPNHLNLGIRYHSDSAGVGGRGDALVRRVLDELLRHARPVRRNGKDRGVAEDAGDGRRVAFRRARRRPARHRHRARENPGRPRPRLPRVPRGRRRKPWCVGVHYFILYDQSALGRFDGECYNIGFLDVCNRPYEALCTAARASHERMYDVATGKAQPFDDAPEYLPKLFA